jgi:chromosome segregation ATPase
MSVIPPNDEPNDLDRTDELPVLVEAAAFESSAAFESDESLDDTATHTARHPELAAERDGDLEALHSDLAARAARIAALEADVARLGTRWSDVERHLTEKDARITQLTQAAEGLRRELAERRAAADELAARLGELDGDREALLREHTEQQAALEAQSVEVEGLRDSTEAALKETEALKDELARQRDLGIDAEEARRLRDELTTLRTYVDNRHSWWQALKARAAEGTRHEQELAREVEREKTLRRRADDLAERESERAVGLRDALARQARESEALRRELAEARAESAEARAPIAVVAPPPPPVEPSPRPAPPPEPPAAPAPSGSADPSTMFEIIAQLEAEVEHKRQQVTAQLAELRERDRRLAAIEAEVDQLRLDLRQARADVDQARADASRLERALIDKDRALEVRDARITTLQSELADRLGALQKLNAMDASLQGLDSKMSERLRRAEPLADPARPALTCLTGDAPRHYVLTKPSTTMGRSSQCDIQILTHFVSREHARIAVTQGGAFIEDLGSTNGVFVNSVRVDRHELHHGDLVTVGETQFRFLESMAH